MEKVLNYQDYEIYSEEDQRTWALLRERHSKINHEDLASEYINGFKKLFLDNDRIVKISEITERLHSICGWSLVPVTGLLATKDFFYLLVEKKYPVTVFIRKPWEIDFSEQPDIFHDIYGHVPLLTNQKFIEFLTAYSTIALKYINNDEAIEFLGRLYWFTYEMGLIKEGENFKPYGGAVITSAEEVLNVKNFTVPKHRFNIDHIFKTVFNSFKLQREYFVIDSFDELFNSLETIEMKLVKNLSEPQQDLVLRDFPLNPNIGERFNDVIGFLNGIQFRYPAAMSFVAGQPDENFFDIENQISKFDTFIEYRKQQNGKDKLEIINGVGQYNKTKGIINDIVARYLDVDENIVINEKNILMTVGAQEAFSIILSTICKKEQDVILVEDPSYIGVSSFAKVFDINIQAIPIDDDGINLKKLETSIVELKHRGLNVKLVYVIPDYQNPSGSCMPVKNRFELLELALRYNFLIIEDSVYNSFTYNKEKNPTIKSLDKFKRVIYVGSFSKSLFPGLRIGLIAADQQIENEQGGVVDLIDEMTKIKAQLTNNTSTITQAILGGVLVDLNFSLNEWSLPKYESYKAKRNVVLDALEKYIGVYKDSWSKEIYWNRPEGGFFIKMSLPFKIDNDDLVECASNYNVIFCPMSYFYLNGGGENEIRLTFSNLSIPEITDGVCALASYLQYRVLSEKINN